jgi:hypothetical protein
MNDIACTNVFGSIAGAFARDGFTWAPLAKFGTFEVLICMGRFGCCHCREPPLRAEPPLLF